MLDERCLVSSVLGGSRSSKVLGGLYTLVFERGETASEYRLTWKKEKENEGRRMVGEERRRGEDGEGGEESDNFSNFLMPTVI